MQPASHSLASHFLVVLPGGREVCEPAAWEGLQLPGRICLFRPPGVIGALQAGLGLDV